MAGTMARALVLLSFLLMSVQALKMPDLRKILGDGPVTPFTKPNLNVARDDGATPMHIQMAPLPYKRIDGTASYYKNKGARKTTLKYGPFNVQPMSQSNGMVDYLQLGASMPCFDCTITWVKAGLEYPDGRYANANTSMWLHHTVFININHPDTVCGSNYYGKGQRWFASGNERTTGDFTNGGKIPTGYYLGLADYHVIEIELMNQAMQAQDAVMTVEFEWIPGKPSDFYSLKPMWLDIAGCDIPSDMPAINDNQFHYSLNKTYTSDWSGALVGMGSHLHDGGTYIAVQNKGATVCNSDAYYGAQPGFVGPDMSMNGANDMPGMPMDTVDHISFMSLCYQPYVGMIKPGDQWGLTAYYDMQKHMPMTNNDGSLSDVMGISVVYAAENMDAGTMAKFMGPAQPNANPPQPASASSLMYASTSAAMSMTMPMDKAKPTTMSSMTMPMIKERDAQKAKPTTMSSMTMPMYKAKPTTMSSMTMPM